MNVLRFVRQAVIGALAIFGALYLGFCVLTWMFFSDENAPKIADIAGSIMSPDGQHKAVVFIWGGPPGVGIQERIGIIPSDRSDAAAWAESNLVYHSSCSALGETLDVMRKHVTWTSAEALEISFTDNGGRGCVINLKDYAGDRGSISVSFVSTSR